MSQSERKKRADIVIGELKKLFPTSQTALTYSNDWELLVSVILSAQCTDKKVNEVTSKLFKKYVSLEAYCHVLLEEFEQDIKSIGLYKSKAKNILKTAAILSEKYNTQIPDSIDELMKLPGVGRKTANVVLSAVHGIHEGIAVDTHVRRLSQKFKLTKEKTPEKIEKDLVKLIPQPLWGWFTNAMIDYGRQYSPARKYDDDSDPISQQLQQQNIL